MVATLRRRARFAVGLVLASGLIGADASAQFFGMPNFFQEMAARQARASGEIANANARLARARNAEERAAIQRTIGAWMFARGAIGPMGVPLENAARAMQAAEDAVRRKLDATPPSAPRAEDPEAIARAEAARQNAARIEEEDRRAYAAAPADINAWIAGQASSIGADAWNRLPGEITGSPYANRDAFLSGMSALGAQSAAELRAQVGMNGRRDFARTKEGLLGLLQLRLGSFVERYSNRIRTMAEVVRRLSPERERLWGQLPGEAQWQRWSFDAEWNSMQSSVAGEIAGRYPDGAKTAPEQSAAMALALQRAGELGRSYADRKINEKKAQEEAAERERRQPENCWRTWQTCAYNIFKPHTEKYDCWWIFCKLRTTYPWECTDWGANEPGCLIRNAWKAATSWITDLWNKFTGFVRQAWAAIERLARDAWAGIERAAKWVAARAQEAADWVGNQMNKLGKTLSRFANLNLADLFADPVGTLFNLLPLDELTEPLMKLLQPLIDAGSRTLESIIQRTLASADKTLMDKVLVPAARWALDKIFGENILGHLREVASRVIGDVPAETRRVTYAQEALRALAERKLDAFDAVMAKREAELAKLKADQNTLLSKAIVAFVNARLLAFIQAQGTRLIRVVLKLLEAPIHAGRIAACSAIDAIPVVGSTISFAVGFLVKNGVTLIRNKVAEFLGRTVARIFVAPFLQKLGDALTSGNVAGKFESWVAPILEPVMPKLAETRAELGRVIDAQSRLTESLRAARKTAEAGPEVKIENVGGGR